MELKFGINLISTLTVWDLLLKRGAKKIEEAIHQGWGFVQILPDRSLSQISCTDLYYAKYYERAWNPVNGFLQALLHKKGGEGMPSTILDWLVFPSQKKCKNLESSFHECGKWLISHHANVPEAEAIETHLGLEMSPLEIRDYCFETMSNLVFDPRHAAKIIRSEAIKRGKRLSNKDLENKLKEALDIWQENITIIHVQPEDINEFLINPLNTMTGRLIKYFLNLPGRPTQIDLIAEYNPGLMAFLFPWISKKKSGSMLKSMKKLTD